MRLQLDTIYRAQNRSTAVAILGRGTIPLYGVDIPSDLYPQVVEVLRAFYINDEVPFEFKTRSTLVALEAVESFRKLAL